MFFLLSKIFSFLCMPLTWIVVLLGYSIWSKNIRRRRRTLFAAFAMLLFFSNSSIVNHAYKLFEYPVVPMDSIQGVYDVGIILGGFTDIGKTPRDRVYLTQAVDRMMHCLYLYKQGKIKKILASGGSGVVGYKPESEAENIKKALMLCGVPEADIILDEEARNTYENALYSAAILKSQFPEGRYLIFTSAFHCRRSAGCFKKQGINADIFPVDFRYSDGGFNLEKTFVPSEDALSKWALLLHEIFGLAIYKILGYA